MLYVCQMKKSCFIFLFLITGITLKIQAQSEKLIQSENSPYQNAIGIKVWDGLGISYKHFFTEKGAIEAIAFFSGHGFRSSGLYEFHFPISAEPGLRWFVGPGLHLGAYDKSHGDGLYFGIDGILGMEYNFQKIPLNLSIDWQPAVEFGNDRGFMGSWGGLAARYIF